jgi:hypothetical protein
MTLAGAFFATAALGHSVQAMATPKERADEKRQEKLADIQEQVDKGQLTIRKMTPAERKANPPRPRKPKS